MEKRLKDGKADARLRVLGFTASFRLPTYEKKTQPNYKLKKLQKIISDVNK